MTILRCMLLLAMTACTGESGTDTAASTSDTNPTDTDVNGSDDTDTDSDSDAVDSDTDDTNAQVFADARWRLTRVRLSEGAHFDLTGDGKPDNKLPDLIASVDILLSDATISVDDINAQLDKSFDSGDIVLFVDGDNTGSELVLGFLRASLDADGNPGIEPDSIDENGDPVQTLTGNMTSAEEFEAGPGDVTLPLAFGDLPFSVTTEGALMAGTLDDTQIDAILGALIPVDVVMDEAVIPLLEAEFDPKEVQTYTALAQSTLQLAADYEAADGSKFLTATMRLQGEALQNP
ncbi:MAG: hypothetical protein ACON5B_11035 [Myxococcota bacterium]